MAYNKPSEFSFIIEKMRAHNTTSNIQPIGPIGIKIPARIRKNIIENGANINIAILAMIMNNIFS